MEENKEKKNKGGRPVKKIKREYSIGFYASLKEKTIIQEKSSKAGARVADYVRELAVNGKVRKRDTPEQIQLYKDIRGAVNNLNQLTKEAHKEGLSGLQTKLVKTLNELNGLLERLRDDNQDEYRP